MVFVLSSIILNRKNETNFFVFILFCIDDMDTNVLFSLLLGFCLYESIGNKYN